VQNYVSKFKRIVALSKQDFDMHTISFLVKISTSLASQYYQLYDSASAVPHRQKELKSFFKKNEVICSQGGAHD